ncbi:PrsW family intramembrane metalloprotease [Curtobacterium flaccumfaciens pv. oortii]|uniref:PrsW family glutamic-type intramembrane protease n=1 Tax=Curtobacterium flaccumfaciens TaxID=2035 RepID=UPI001BDF2CF5|nr:PrsW family glutamic-type intramembrane protease [Curtobacterium flaccumfaciens]MBT1623127.1 PrsW family intramembrane metalloprotease [Curtobacterium flaccumfaciens pv. oortii]
MTRPRGTAPLIVGLAGAAAGALLGYWGGSLMLSGGREATVGDGLPPYSLVVVVIAAIIGIGVPLVAIGWYFRQKVSLAGLPHRVQALWLGLVWGTIAMLLAGSLNGIASLLPGGLIWPGLVEEFLKLLVPVILLLSSRTYRSPRLGAWLVLVAAAWLGFLEGISYIITSLDPILDGAEAPSDAPFVMMMDVIVRIIAEVSHPLITVGAAVLIWLAAKTLPTGRAIGVGVLAYLGAAAIHGLNDAVIDGPVRDWNVPVSIVLEALYVVAVFVFWFRPQVRRLQGDGSAHR